MTINNASETMVEDMPMVQMYDLDEEGKLIVNEYRDFLGPNLVFFTITLRPKLYKYQALTQYELTDHEVNKILDRYTMKARYSVELTNDCNVHYHGIARVRDKIQLMNFIESTRRNRSLGFMKVNPPINNLDQLHRVANYICKDLNTTRKIICRNGYRPILIKNI